MTINPTVPFRVAKQLATREWERAYLEALLDQSDGNISRAAREAQMDRTYLVELLRRHGLTCG